jgi:hypothetical protein
MYVTILRPTSLRVGLVRRRRGLERARLTQRLELMEVRWRLQPDRDLSRASVLKASIIAIKSSPIADNSCPRASEGSGIARDPANKYPYVEPNSPVYPCFQNQEALCGHLREHGLLRSYFDAVDGSRQVAWLLYPSTQTQVIREPSRRRQAWLALDSLTVACVDIIPGGCA